MNITPSGGENSKNNFKNKKIVIVFCDDNFNELCTIETYLTNQEGEVIDITSYRNALNIDSKDIKRYFYYDIYMGSQKAPTSYTKTQTGSYLFATINRENA